MAEPMTTPEEARALLEDAQSVDSTDWRVEYRWGANRDRGYDLGYDVVDADGKPPVRAEEIAALMAAAPALARTVIELHEKLEKVRWLAEPYVDQPDGYQHYAINLTDGVHFAVLLDDLRNALGEKP